jgi:hypothetical protein
MRQRDNLPIEMGADPTAVIVAEVYEALIYCIRNSRAGEWPSFGV